MRKIYISLLVLVLVGCQSMPEGLYQKAGKMEVGIQRCFQAGHVDPQLFADTRSAVSYALNGWWDYDANKLGEYMNRIDSYFTPTVANCRNIAAEAYSLVSQANIKRANRPDYSAPSAFDIPMPVYCNTVGFSTVCQ